MTSSFEHSASFIAGSSGSDESLHKIYYCLQQCDFDKDRLDDTTADIYGLYIPLAQYMAVNNIALLDTWNRQITVDIVGRILKGVYNNLKSKIVFRQQSNPYYFYVEGPDYKSFLPLVTTRALFSLLKTLKYKVEVCKKNRSLCTPLAQFCMDLAFLGKSDVDIPGGEVLADACKNLKGRATPWFPEDNAPATQEEEDMLSEASLRFRGAEWFMSAQKSITLIGCGGLGSNIAVSLCRVMGDQVLRLFDPDKVEYRNLAGQNFGITDVGKYKVTAVEEQCRNFNPLIDIKSRPEAFDLYSVITTDIIVTGLDNMATRYTVYDHFKSRSHRTLLIDARLSAEKWQVFCLQNDDEKALRVYEDEWLFPDSEAEEDVCSYKQTAFAAQMCASFVTNVYVNYCANLVKEEEDPTRRYVPFMTEYDATQMVLRFTAL